jgi:hypothetical protein
MFVYKTVRDSSSHLLLYASVLYVLFSLSSAAPVTNTIPPGVAYYVSPDEICLKAGWLDILTFYIGNYVAHAATIRRTPGGHWSTNLLQRLISLLFPPFGLQQAVSDIVSLPLLGRSKLQVACRSGALLMLVRDNQWTPIAGDCIAEGFLLKCDITGIVYPQRRFPR